MSFEVHIQRLNLKYFALRTNWAFDTVKVMKIFVVQVNFINSYQTIIFTKLTFDTLRLKIWKSTFSKTHSFLLMGRSWSIKMKEECFLALYFQSLSHSSPWDMSITWKHCIQRKILLTQKFKNWKKNSESRYRTQMYLFQFLNHPWSAIYQGFYGRPSKTI